MRLHVVGSGSAGNAYILENHEEALLLECGMHFKHVKQALGFNVGKVVGCLVTHEHKDHCSAVREVLAAGIDVYASVGTHKMMGTLEHHRGKSVLEEKRYSIGGFRVMPFHVKHDAEQPLGYLISHADCGNVLFITDTWYVPTRFAGVHNIIVEANYCEQIVEEKERQGMLPNWRRNRLFTSHMSLRTCKELLAANDLTAVNNIVLVHLSDSNSDAARFQREVANQTGKRVHIASAGLVIENFGKQPF